MKALDLRINWLDAARIIATALQAGTPEGKRLASEELVKMAYAADFCAELSKALQELVRLKAIKQRIDARAATPDERADYKRSKQSAWNRAAALAKRIA